jgi:myo-inositol-1(or 4)-monophosphatase
MMPARRWSDLADVAASAAQLVGDTIDVERIEIVQRKKGRANFATAADHAAQEEIIERLAAHDRSIPVLAEEGAAAKTKRAERLWVVDPIDGTLNFSRALPFYCVSVAYVEDGRVRAGAIHAPRTGETFVAHQGGGARLNGAPIAVSQTRELGQAFVVTSLAFRAASRPSSRFVMLNAHCARMRMFGSAALEIAYVAAGRFDLFVHGALGPWDVAAGGLIAREAGAAMLSLTTAEEAAWDESQVIIGPPALVRDALRTIPELVRPVAPGQERSTKGVKGSSSSQRK